MIVKLLIFALAGYALYRLFINDKNRKTELSEKDRQKRIESGLMVKDPVCGTYVEKDSGITVRSGDEVICFCSYECRDKYLKQIGYDKDGSEA